MPENHFLRYFKTALLAIFLFLSEGAFAGIYNLQTPLSTTEQAAVQALLDRAETLLPARLKTAVKSIDVRVEKIQAPSSPDGSKRDVVGITKGRVITINTTYLRDIVAGPQGARKTPQRQHKNAYDEALAAVLHESTHVYDELNIHSGDERTWISRCRNFTTAGNKGRSVLPTACAGYKDMSHTLSQNPYFLAEAGWINGKDTSGHTQRSPDIYENKSPQEYLSVNMEYFLMDPEYKCRRPSMYRLLRDHFEHRPFSDVKCDDSLGFVIPKSPSSKAQLLSIDPSRVYQIHYLLADTGDHAMIRLVVCAPGKDLGPECMKDVDQSVVLTYRAFKERYPSRLFVMPFEYIRNEQRRLLSIPLKLSRQEIENLVVRSIETHWSYDGRYFFAANNASIETFNLIKSSTLRADLMFADVRQVGTQTQMRNIDANSLRAMLNQMGLLDESVLRNKSLALDQGYYFDSPEGARIKNVFSMPADLLRGQSGYGLPDTAEISGIKENIQFQSSALKK